MSCNLCLIQVSETVVQKFKAIQPQSLQLSRIVLSVIREASGENAKETCQGCSNTMVLYACHPSIDSILTDFSSPWYFHWIGIFLNQFRSRRWKWQDVLRIFLQQRSMTPRNHSLLNWIRQLRVWQDAYRTFWGPQIMGANQTIPLRLAAIFGCHMRFIQKRIKKKHPRIKYIQRNMVGLLLSALAFHQ